MPARSPCSSAWDLPSAGHFIAGGLFVRRVELYSRGDTTVNSNLFFLLNYCMATRTMVCYLRILPVGAQDFPAEDFRESCIPAIPHRADSGSSSRAVACTG